MSIGQTTLKRLVDARLTGPPLSGNSAVSAGRSYEIWNNVSHQLDSAGLCAVQFGTERDSARSLVLEDAVLTDRQGLWTPILNTGPMFLLPRPDGASHDFHIYLGARSSSGVQVDVGARLVPVDASYYQAFDTVNPQDVDKIWAVTSSATTGYRTSTDATSRFGIPSSLMPSFLTRRVTREGASGPTIVGEMYACRLVICASVAEGLTAPDFEIYACSCFQFVGDSDDG